MDETTNSRDAVNEADDRESIAGIEEKSRDKKVISTKKNMKKSVLPVQNPNGIKRKTEDLKRVHWL